MPKPLYLLDKLARHGQAVERLRDELRQERASSDDPRDACDAIAFDAANMVWSFLILSGHDAAQESREIRNAVAEAIYGTLREVGVSGEELTFNASDL